MSAEFLTLVLHGLVTLVLAVGVGLSVLVAKRFGRSVAWFCAVGCFVFFVLRLMRLLWVADAVHPEQGRVLNRLFEFGLQFAPLLEAGAFLLLIVAALRGKRVQESPVEPVRRPGVSFLRRGVAFPVWAVGVVVVLVAGALVTVAALTPTDDAVPRLVKGTVTEHLDDGVGFRFVADGGPTDPELYWPNSRFWVDSRGAQRNDARPTCLRPEAALPQRVELAFLDIKGGREHAIGDFPYLLSVRCLG